MRRVQLGALLSASWQIIFALVRLILKTIWMGGHAIWIAIFTVPVIVIFADSSLADLRWGAVAYVGLIAVGAIIGLGLRHLIKRKLSPNSRSKG